MMTPPEGWSDVGSDTTEKIHEPHSFRVIDHVASSQGVSECHEDRSLEVIFSEMGLELTEEDVSRLIRHWTS